jgi:transcriptional repressor NrdR
MVCIYCGHPKTEVTNSRLQKQTNEIWRRRQCAACANIFTSYEYASLDKGMVVQYDTVKMAPFSRDRLFLSIYESCKHQSGAIDNATALVQTITSRLVATAQHGAIVRSNIIAISKDVLERFDPAAATIYSAYHA